MTPFMVNLLPWRQRRLVRRSRYWCLLLLFHAGWLSMAMFAGKHMTARQRSAQETALAVALQQHQQRTAILHQVQQAMATLQQQQDGRQANAQARAHNQRYVTLLEQLSVLVPAGLWLTALAAQDEGVSMSGLSHDYSDIVQFSTQLERHTSLTAVRILHARQASSPALSENNTSPLTFQLQADWRADIMMLAPHE